MAHKPLPVYHHLTHEHERARRRRERQTHACYHTPATAHARHHTFTSERAAADIRDNAPPNPPPATLTSSACVAASTMCPDDMTAPCRSRTGTTPSPAAGSSQNAPGCPKKRKIEYDRRWRSSQESSVPRPDAISGAARPDAISGAARCATTARTRA